MPRNVLWVSSTDNNGLAKSPRDERLRFQLWWISQSQARPQFFGMLPGLKLDHEDNKGYSVYEFHHDFTWQLHYTEIILQSLKERRFKLGTTRQWSFRSQSHKRPWYARRSVLSEQENKMYLSKTQTQVFPNARLQKAATPSKSKHITRLEASPASELIYVDVPSQLFQTWQHLES